MPRQIPLCRTANNNENGNNVIISNTIICQHEHLLYSYYTFTYSTSTIERLEKGAKYVQS